MDIKVKIATPSLDRVIERLGEGERAALNEEMAVELEETIREHVVRYARVHHATAARLNGQRTGNLEDARFAHESGADGAVVTVGASGIRRALGPLQVIARNRKCLTIPAHGLAYGHRVGQIERAGYAVFRPKGKDYLAIREDGKEGITVLYFLVKRATLKHAPDLMPTIEKMAQSCRAAAEDFIFGGG